MNNEEMKAELIAELDFWKEKLEEERSYSNFSMITAIKQRQSAVISFSKRIDIITFEEQIELENDYALL